MRLWIVISRATASIALCAAPFSASIHAPGTAQTTPHSPRIEILVPARLIAGRPATLATLGTDRKLAPHVAVDLGSGDHLQTDATGRANFMPPKVGVLIAKSAGATTAALVDADSEEDSRRQIAVAPFAALHDGFDICGGGFQGNAEGNHVYINDEPVLILAASPECVAAAPSPKTSVGPANVLVEDRAGPRRASITFVSLDFEPPQPPLTATKKGWLTVRVRGTDQRLRILVENETPDVLQFERGDEQVILTSGGADNIEQIKVEAIRSGDFGFHARVLPPADPVAARRFLEAAEPLAFADVVRTLKKIEADLAHHPAGLDRIRAELDRMLTTTSPSDFRTLLEAARSAL